MPKKRKHRTAFQRANDMLEAEGRKQCTLLYGATGIVLNRMWGKGQKAIINFFDVTGEVWRDCASTNLHSMVELCEQETGIEIQNGEGKSWRDLPYMNATLDTGRMTYAQWIYMRQQQTKWIPAQIMACMLISLHRKYGYGYRKCAEIYRRIQETEAEYGYDPEKIRTACMEIIGIDIVDTFTKPRDTREGKEVV